MSKKSYFDEFIESKKYITYGVKDGAFKELLELTLHYYGVRGFFETSQLKVRFISLHARLNKVSSRNLLSLSELIASWKSGEISFSRFVAVSYRSWVTYTLLYTINENTPIDLNTIKRLKYSNILDHKREIQNGKNKSRNNITNFKKEIWRIHE